MTKIFKNITRDTVKNLALVVLGTLVLSFGVAVFVIPLELVMGGVSGLGIILSNVINVEFLTVDVIISILTWAIFFLGLIILGKDFAMKTLVSSIVYPPALSLFMRLFSSGAFGGFFTVDPSAGHHVVISAVFGGMLIGCGCALTFLGGGSTGGTDILAFIITKFTKIKSSIAMGIVDGSIVIIGMFFADDFFMSLLGILAVAISTTVIDKVFVGGSGAFVAEIISEKHAEINKAIITEIDRTTTIIGTVGGYTGKEQKMLKVTFTMRQYADVMNIINRFDKGAFVTVHRAHEINGRGWTIEKEHR